MQVVAPALLEQTGLDALPVAMQPLLFDTDIGSDIDDAVALAYLLRQPECELLGITTATGEPQQRARLASATCTAAGRDDVPIHSGTEDPILIPLKQQRAAQAAILADFAHQQEFPPNTAIEFMRQAIHARPGEVTLLAVGPMTNVGLLFATDPEVPRLLKRLVLMVGRFTSRTPGASPVEWNAVGDPHALARVCAAPVPELTAFGLDVTLRCRLDAAEFRRRVADQAGPLQVVAAMAEVWFQHREVITFHDPLAAACVFAPELCEYQRGRIEVELLSRRVEGMTHWDPKAEPAPHRIAVEVDAAAFFRHYFAAVTAA